MALLIDYTGTGAVQTAAGSAAIVSAFPQLANIPVIGSNILVFISVIASARDEEDRCRIKIKGRST